MILKFPGSASRPILARRPRRSKNGTPEERAAKVAGDPKTGAPKRQRWSKNGTPAQRAAKAVARTRPATIVNLSQRSATKHRPIVPTEVLRSHDSGRA